MNLKDIPKEELQSMGYDEIAYLILEKNGKKMKLLDLFKSVSKALDLDEEAVMDHITDFFELLLTTDLNIELETYDLIEILFLFSLSYIFEYGRLLGLEIKGQMYGNCTE